MGRAYRGDIDGLRALSVLAVLLFHADLGVPGGFVGVDVFFVISGYLITGLVVADLSAGTFSMARFWERRLRRIWPAALAVTITVLAAGWWLMLPSDYRVLGGDAVAQVAMLANVRYWSGTDYFATSSDFRPLLHTWSLAVEEQFYVIFPFLLVGVHRVGRRALPWAMFALMATSFVASLVAIGRWPGAAFYLLPFRAWELLLGGVLAVLPPPAFLRRVSGDVLAVLGLAMIFWCCIDYSRSTPFPGIAAAAPALGAALAILGCGLPGSLVASALGSVSLRSIGLMSYSLYLWHWPILAFARYRYGLELPLPIAAGALVAAFVVAALSYRWIETPFRAGLRGWGSMRVAFAAVAASLLPLAAAAVIWRLDGFPSRVDPEVVKFSSGQSMPRSWDLDSVGLERLFLPIGAPLDELGVPCFILLGDSHGTAVSSAFDRAAADRGLSGKASLRGAFLPLPGLWRPGARNPEADRQAHIEFDASLARELSSHTYKHLILCARWSGYLGDGRTDVGDCFRVARLSETATSIDGARVAMAEGIRRLLEITEPAGTEIWLLLEVPVQDVGPHRRSIDAMHTGALSLDGSTRVDHGARVSSVASVMEAFTSPRLHVVDLSEPFFDSRGVSLVGRPGLSWYFDDDHVSAAGADEALGSVISGIFDRIARACAPGAQAPTSAPAP
jgi:peptidoglycan/LPS O-acetylase OafA/YrhL